MKLTMGERFVLLQILPERGNLLSLKAARILREALVPTEKERKEYKFVEDVEAGRIEWDPALAGKTAEIEIPPIMTEIITRALKDLDQKEQLTERFVPLYEKFIPEIK